MAAPAWTYNSVGNILASTTLTNGAPNSQAIDFSTFMAGQIQIADTATTVTAGAGVQVTLYRDFTTNNDNVPFDQYFIASVGSATAFQSIELSSGKYHITLANTDASHTVAVVITSNTLSWPA